MTKDEALRMALEALETGGWNKTTAAITALREALASEAIEQPAQQEPVAWLITDEKINSLQVDSIQRLIDRARHAHMTDIKLRINGQDEWYQADWLKHLIRATPPQRTWVGLTWEEIDECFKITPDQYLPAQIYRRIEAKLKQKNGYAEENT